jgi:Galactose oxidase, central domain
MSCASTSGDTGVSCGGVANLTGSTESSGSATATLPSDRYGAAMTYDGADGYVLLFSGSSRTDTWSFANGAWTQIFPPSSPPARVDASMAYDAHDGYVVLFGGSAGSSGGYNNTSNYLNDTWSYLHGIWSPIEPTSPTPENTPSPRYGAAMTYDAQDGYVVLFGGDFERNFLNNTWKFVGGQWTNITPSSQTPLNTPPCRFDAGMTDDAQSVVLFGGDGKAPIGTTSGCSASYNNQTLSDTWSFRAGVWKPLNLSAAHSPPPSWAVSMTYDAKDGYVVLFGGITTTDMAIQETWAFSSGKWTLISPLTYPATSPPARFSASMTFDARDGYVVLIGGLSEPQHNAPLLDDVWTYNSSRWTNLTVNPIPPFRTSMAMTYDQKDGYVLLFGGQNNSGTPLADTWKYVSGVWFQLTPPESPPARYDASIAYDANSADQYVVLFGGYGRASILDDTWSFVRGNWTEVNPSSGAPTPRYGAAMAYDSNSRVARLVLFGGEDPQGDLLNDTWLYFNGNWSNVSAAKAPPTLVNASMVYDNSAGDHYLLLFGGIHGTGASSGTWEFTSAETWAKPSLGNGPSPPARFGANLVYDTADGYVLLYGGASNTGILGDTWTYVKGVWTQLSPVPSPPGRYGAGMAYLPSENLTVLYGGTWSAASPANLRTDVWVFAAGTWTNVTLGPVQVAGSSPGSHSAGWSGDDTLVVAVAAVAVVVLAVLLLRRRNRPSSAPTGSEVPQEPAPADSTPSTGSAPNPGDGSSVAASSEPSVGTDVPSEPAVIK